MRRKKKTDYPLISVVVLNYNGLKYLKRTVPPILKLDYPKIEIIYVDNGSTDGSIEFLKKFKKIKLIENGKNLGYSKGKNIGVKNANGEYVLLVDNDILIRRKNTLINLIDQYSKGIGLVQVPLLNSEEKKTKYYGLYLTYYGFNMDLEEINIKNILKYKENLLEIVSPTGGDMFFRKGDWLSRGGFDESQKFNIDDIDIGPRFYLEGLKNYLYTKDYFIHLGIENSKSSKNYHNRSKFMFSGHSRSFIKNFKFITLIRILPIFFIFQFIKSIRYSFKKRTIKVFFAFLSSIGLFLKNLPDTLKKRKEIQAKRVIKDDIFLKIKPPKFE